MTERLRSFRMVPKPRGRMQEDATLHAENEIDTGSATLNLPGFAVQDALDRLQGNQRLYIKLLNEFARAHANDCTRIREALDAGNFEEARALTHTLKGIAGNLSVRRLYVAASALETELFSDENKHELEAKLIELGKATEQAIDTIQTGVSNSYHNADSTTDDTPVDPSQAIEAARRVREAAESGDITQVIAAIEILPRDHVIASSWHRWQMPSILLVYWNPPSN